MQFWRIYKIKYNLEHGLIDCMHVKQLLFQDFTIFSQKNNRSLLRIEFHVIEAGIEFHVIEAVNKISLSRRQ